MTRRTSLVVGATALLLAAGGCVGPFAPEPEGTSTTSEDPAGRQLDEAAADLALPIVADLPAGVRIDRQEGSEVAEQRTEPDGCLDANFAGPARTAIDDSMVADVSRSFTHTTKRGSASVTIRSYDTEVPDSLFTAAGTAVGRCSPMKRFSTFEGEDEDEVVDTVSIEGLGVPQVGERTYSTRFTITDSTEPMSRGGVADYLAFKRGHTLVTVVYFVAPTSERVEGLTSTLAGIVDRNLREG
ncbi:hypothetical protein AWH69_03730 [Janibacter melonis]|uniref:DUF5642 domain-containing protein n=1 Tax=Janibacter melonis TaxID=262209 RepID=A0A176QGX9_9MICO|nr:hypothetical protein [Janibacter melonis]MBD5831167.1 hypothetical protein [Janibacter melonis]OAB88888.1 hypothetical protein AWH69_03730 [Janibacter melonis]